MTTSQPEGFLALPAAGTGSAVLVLHAWWGLNETIRAFCQQLAGAGFVAFAPDLYHGRLTDTIPGAEALSSALDHEQASRDVAAAVTFLGTHPANTGRGLAVVGFSLGAYFALDISAADPEHIRSVVVFYGTGDLDFSTSRAAYLGHFAEEDPFEPQVYVDGMEEAMRAAGRPVTFHRYPGTGHWFFEPDRAQAYNQAAAGLAWERSLAFLREMS